MSARIIEGRLRWFLLVLAGLMCLGTIIELWLTEHTEEPIQFLPFILCGAGFVTIVAVGFRPQRWTIIALRLVMGAVVLGSLFGTFEHVKSNVAFELEIRPNAALGNVFGDALHGATPLMAPGILALMAIIAIASTYYHPALGNRQNDSTSRG